jgi:hypothetical protein
MLEQELINAFMKFSAKAGAGELIKDLIRSVDENGNPKTWTTAEMQNAIRFLNQRVETFDKEQAAVIIQTLMRKFGLRSQDITMPDESFLESNEITGVQGLQ